MEMQELLYVALHQQRVVRQNVASGKTTDPYLHKLILQWSEQLLSHNPESLKGGSQAEVTPMHAVTIRN